MSTAPSPPPRPKGMPVVWATPDPPPKRKSWGWRVAGCGCLLVILAALAPFFVMLLGLGATVVTGGSEASWSQDVERIGRDLEDLEHDVRHAEDL